MHWPETWFTVGIGWFSLYLLTAPSPLAAREPSLAPDHAAASVDGKVGLGFWPKDQESGLTLHPAGFQVHLIAQEEDQVRSFPCGVWFSPPTGHYSFFVEGPGKIAPFMGFLKYTGTPYRGRGMAGIEQVVDAGTVRVPPQIALGAGKVLRLIHLNSHNRKQRYPQRELVRTADEEESRRGVLMPTGPVLAAFYHPERQEYLALARPVEVALDGLTHVEPRLPTTGSDLLVILQRPQTHAEFKDYEADLRLATGNRPVPDVLIPTPTRFYAVWYSLEQEQVTLEARSPVVELRPQTILLRAGAVTTFRADLTPQSAPNPN